MTEIPRKKIDELLRRAGFSGEEICGGIRLLSVYPIPVLEIGSDTWETAKMWRDIFDGKNPSIKEVSTAYYQCLLLGQVIGVKVITMEPDLNNPGEWKKESKVEIIVYKKTIKEGEEEWVIFNIIQREGKTLEAAVSKFDEVQKVAKFMELVVMEENNGTRKRN